MLANSMPYGEANIDSKKLCLDSVPISMTHASDTPPIASGDSTQRSNMTAEEAATAIGIGIHLEHDKACAVMIQGYSAPGTGANQPPAPILLPASAGTQTVKTTTIPIQTQHAPFTSSSVANITPPPIQRTNIPTNTQQQQQQMQQVQFPSYFTPSPPMSFAPPPQFGYSPLQGSQGMSTMLYSPNPQIGMDLTTALQMGQSPQFFSMDPSASAYNNHIMQQQAAHAQYQQQSILMAQQSLINAQVQAANSAAQQAAATNTNLIQSGMSPSTQFRATSATTAPLASNNPLRSFLKPSYLSSTPIPPPTTNQVISHLTNNIQMPANIVNAYNPYSMPPPMMSPHGFIQTSFSPSPMFGPVPNSMQLTSTPPQGPMSPAQQQAQAQEHLAMQQFMQQQQQQSMAYQQQMVAEMNQASMPLSMPPQLGHQNSVGSNTTLSSHPSRKRKMSQPSSSPMAENSLLSLLDASNKSIESTPSSSSTGTTVSLSSSTSLYLSTSSASSSSSMNHSKRRRASVVPARVREEREQEKQQQQEIEEEEPEQEQEEEEEEEEEQDKDSDQEDYSESHVEPRGRPKASKAAAAAAALHTTPANMAALIAASLEPEVDTVNGGVLYVCRFPSCGDVFKTRFSLKRHLKKHSGEKPFVCTYEGCAKRFAEKSTLKRHVRIHTGEKPYRCSIPGCGKYFADRTNVKRHEMIHSGMRPYWCPHENCSRGYFWRKHLRKHCVAVHKRELAMDENDEEEEGEDEGEEDVSDNEPVEELDRDNMPDLSVSPATSSRKK